MTRLLFVLRFVIFASAVGSLHASQTSTEQSALSVTCPQCGNWTISYSPRASFVGEVVAITEGHVSIPGCGEFSYEVDAASMQPKRAYEHSDTSQLQLTLAKESEGFLCKSGESKEYKMDLTVSGHFQQGGTIEMTVRHVEQEKTLLSAFAWNLDREQPGDSGSAMGSGAAFNIAYSHLYAALAREVEFSYRLLQSHKLGTKGASFNVARFSADTLKFCVYRERNSGGGGWPFVWARDCQYERLERKFSEVLEWQDCVVAKKGNSLVCRFPDESFDRSPKEE